MLSVYEISPSYVVVADLQKDVIVVTGAAFAEDAANDINDLITVRRKLYHKTVLRSVFVWYDGVVIKDHTGFAGFCMLNGVIDELRELSMK